jgi:hypothetical protein
MLFKSLDLDELSPREVNNHEFDENLYSSLPNGATCPDRSNTHSGKANFGPPPAKPPRKFDPKQAEMSSDERKSSLVTNLEFENNLLSKKIIQKNERKM